MSRLLIVSNRLPISIERRGPDIHVVSSIGGLATGLGSFYKSCDSLWVGWPEVAVEDLDDSSRRKVRDRLRKERCVPVFLAKDDVRGYYHGFSNETIWPTFHHFTQYAKFEQGTWDAYRRVNERFAEAVARAYKPGDDIWIQDYQLMLLPGILRGRLPSASIGFFLHIPFPSFEIFRMLPWRNEILNGLLGADLIGFHTYDYAQHFLKTVSRLTTYESTMGHLAVGPRLVKVDAFPMGIDFERFDRAGDLPDVADEVKRIGQRTQGRKIILSLDRLDYTKGIVERLEAFEEFLKTSPEYRGKVHLILVAVPSRTGVEHYRQLKHTVDQMIGRINGELGTLDWMPIMYLYRKLPFHRMAALYCVSDVSLVTPLRDGMNLIAKEYVASKHAEQGVLILSELAGAAKEMGEAILVNPFNRVETVEAISAALEMPEEEQRERLSAMRKRLERFDVARWAQTFVNSLSGVKEAQEDLNARRLSEPFRKEMLESYEGAGKRLLLLDYDGTLVPFSRNPLDARPDPELIGILKKLTEDRSNQVVIISGRDRATLGTWMEDLDVGWILEHGALVRRPGEEWESLAMESDEWKEPVQQILYQYADRTPGAFVEEKQYSLVWHYRASDPELADVRARELKDALSHLVSNMGLAVMEGNKVLEVKQAGVNKGQAALKWLNGTDWGFILAAGDDRTDEDVFGSMPEDAWTLKVGWGPSRARFSIDGHADTRSLLKRMTGG